MYDGDAVPEVLLSGNHKEIEKWRRMQSLKNTLQKRPDLLDKAVLTTEDLSMLKELKNSL